MTDPRQTGTSRIDPENPNHELSERDARKSQGLEKDAGKEERRDQGAERSRPAPGKTPGSAEGEDD